MDSYHVSAPCRCWYDENRMRYFRDLKRRWYKGYVGKSSTPPTESRTGWRAAGTSRSFKGAMHWNGKEVALRQKCQLKKKKNILANYDHIELCLSVVMLGFVTNWSKMVIIYYLIHPINYLKTCTQLSVCLPSIHFIINKYSTTPPPIQGQTLPPPYKVKHLSCFGTHSVKINVFHVRCDKLNSLQSEKTTEGCDKN